MNDDNYLTRANWRHQKSGVSYRITGFTTREQDHVTLVNYHSCTDPHGPIWTRPASEFFDGRFVRLFLGYREPKL